MLRAGWSPWPRAGGKTEFVQIGARDVRGCIACGKCAEKQDRQATAARTT